MIYRKFRKCYCINNNQNCQDNSNVIETSCSNNFTNCNELNFNENCECGFDENPEMDVFPSDPMLAQSYVPIQYMDKTFKPCVGLNHGTIYPELVSPYKPGQSLEEIEYLKMKKGCSM